MKRYLGLLPLILFVVFFGAVGIADLRWSLAHKEKITIERELKKHYEPADARVKIFMHPGNGATKIDVFGMMEEKEQEKLISVLKEIRKQVASKRMEVTFFSNRESGKEAVMLEKSAIE
jgi:hypothetical protein